MNPTSYPNLIEKTIKKEVLHEGRFLKLLSDEVLLPDGRVTVREYLDHPGSVAVIPILNKERIVMVKQFRYPANQVLLEIPAGKMDFGEMPEESAQRELAEETGYRSRNWTHLASIWTSPGFCNEQLHLYLAEDLEPGSTAKDEDEFVEVVTLTKAELETLLNSGEAVDGKTILAVNVLKSKNLW